MNDLKNETVLFRCDASYELGFGHLMRCLALAEELARTHGNQPVFAIREDVLAQDLLERKGFAYSNLTLEDDETYYGWLLDLFEQTRPRAFILDVRDNLPVEALREARRRRIVTATIDDATPKRLLVDLAFYPPNPQFGDLEWTGFAGQVFHGPEWIILSPKYSRAQPKPTVTVPRVLLTMGGSDPFGLTHIAVESLGTITSDFSTHIVLGPGFKEEPSLIESLRSIQRRYQVYRGVPDLTQLMADSDLALVAFGTTAYELAAAGIPAVYLCISESHRLSASYLESRGAGLVAGTLPNIENARVAEALGGLIEDRERCIEMSQKARRTVDGRGALRVGDQIAGSILRTS